MGWLILFFIIGLIILWIGATGKLGDKIKKEFGERLKKMHHINALYKIITLKDDNGAYLAFLHDGELYYKKIKLMEVQRDFASDVKMAVRSTPFHQMASTLIHKAVLKVVLEDNSVIDIDISANHIPVIQMIQRDIAAHRASFSKKA